MLVDHLDQLSNHSPDPPTVSVLTHGDRRYEPAVDAVRPGYAIASNSAGVVADRAQKLSSSGLHAPASRADASRDVPGRSIHQ